MKRSFFSVICILLSIQNLKAQSDNFKSEENLNLEKACSKDEALACAKLAYRYQKMGEASLAYKFYKKGCDLKEESACFNLKNVDPNEIYFKKIEGALKLRSSEIINCYKPDLRLKQSTIQLKEKWYLVDMLLYFNNAGFPERIDIKTSLPEEFVNCAKKIIGGISFPKTEGVKISFNYKLSIMSQE